MMKHYYNYLICSLLLGIFTLMGCREDEKLNLTTYPVNRPSIVISNTEGTSEVALNAVYNQDGVLDVNGLVSRTYTLRLATPSPEDAIVTFELLSVNIPIENIELSETEVVIPAGLDEASFIVNLKNEDFSFAEEDFEAKKYELGVRARVKGYKMDETEFFESKVVVEKEAYVASCYVVGQFGNRASFDRLYVDGEITNTDPISYTFKVQMDKPSKSDVRVRLATTGLGEQFMDDVTITPNDIVIPAGQLSTGDITWTVTDDFLLQTEEEESHSLALTASIECDDPKVILDEERNTLTFAINKLFKFIEMVGNVESNWSRLSMQGWTTDIDPTVDYGFGTNNLIDGRDNTNVRKKDGFWWFIVDMKSVKTIAGISLIYYKPTNCPPRVSVSISVDNVTWLTTGSLDVPTSKEHHFKFLSPTEVRYVKYELFEPGTVGSDVNGIFIYEPND